MLKPLTAFAHTFTQPKDYAGIIDTVLATSKCSALFLSGMGVETIEGKVLYWKDSLDSSNYLYAAGALPSSTGSYSMQNAPSYIASDSVFNDQPSIDFDDEGDTRLLLANPVRVKCAVIVYLVRNTSSYLIYAPRTIPGANEASTIYYDAFPAGDDSSLWSDELLNNSAAFNATSRINARNVPPDQTITPNVPRCLSISNINERIEGFGGKTGRVGGTNPKVSLDSSLSVQGKIAAIALFDEDLTEEELLNIETSLGLLYLQYQGIQKLNDPPLTFTIDQSFSIDLNEYFNDEWFLLENFELVSPPSELPLLDVTGEGLLTGVASSYFEGTISIRITNSNAFSQVFQVPFRSLEVDELVADIQQIYEPVFIFSADDNKGFYEDRWEDARRLESPALIYSAPVFQISNTSFNSNSYIFTDTASLTLNSPASVKSLMFVYRQTIGGVRKFSNMHDDIYGTGNLLTVASPSDIFGSSSKTRWKSYVQTVQVSSFGYKLPLYEEMFVCFTNISDMSISSFPLLKGDVAYIIGFREELAPEEIRDLVAVLAGRYYVGNSPLVFDSSIAFSTTEDVSIDLSTRVVDLKGSYPLEFELLSPVYDASIVANDLSFTAELDERVELSLRATNSLENSTDFTLFVDTLLKDNPLYRDLRSTGVLFHSVYIPTVDSIDGTTWLEYSGTGSDAALVGTSYATSNVFDGQPVIRFNSNGSSYAEFDTAVEGNLFVFAYKRNADASALAFLLGQDSLSEFFSGVNGELLHPSLSITPEAVYVNGELRSKTYRIPSEVLSIIIIKTTAQHTIDSIAKHKLFDTDSVKGEVGLVAVANHSGTVPYEDIFLAVQAYYLPAKQLISLPLLSNLQNISPGGISRISGTAAFSASPAGLRLVASRVTISNESQFAFQNFDFRISFTVVYQPGAGKLNILKMPLLEVYVEEGEVVVTDQLSRLVAVSVGFNTPTNVVIERISSVLSVNEEVAEWSVNYLDYLSPLVVGELTPSREGLSVVRNLVVSRS